MIKVDVAVATIKGKTMELEFHEVSGWVGSTGNQDDVYDIVEKWTGRVHAWFMPEIPLKIETQITNIRNGKLIDITASYTGGKRVNAMMLATEVSE